jgi:L-fuconolactonase
MVVIDAQIHTFYSDRPSRPWTPEFRPQYVPDRPSYLQHAGQTNSPDMALAEMDDVQVDAALLIPVGMYGTSLELELDAAEAHPDRFRVVGLIDHLAPGLGEHLASARSRGLVGVRILEMREPERVARGEFDDVLRLCADLDLVVTLSLRHPLDPRLVELFERYSDVFFVIDHLGTGFAPPILGYRPDQPFEQLDAVIALARFPNIGLKLTGAPSLSVESYPFKDIWEPVTRLIAAFGAERVYWGADYSRTAALHSYHEARHYLAEVPSLSQEQLDLVYGEALAHRLDWHPAPTTGGR